MSAKMNCWCGVRYLFLYQVSPGETKEQGEEERSEEKSR